MRHAVHWRRPTSCRGSRGARSCRGRRSPATRTTRSPRPSRPAATHLRLRIFPDGGVARLRVHGDVTADWDRLRRRGDVDLAAAEHGGLVVACSDMFFGSRHNLIMPGDATHMGDGWETKRRRGPGHDWTIVRLGDRGRDSTRGNRHAPLQGERAGRLQPGRRGRRTGAATLAGLAVARVLPRTALQPHTRHIFEDELRPARRRHARAVQYLSRTAASGGCACSAGRDRATQRTQAGERNVFSLRSLRALRLCACHMRLEELNALDEESAAASSADAAGRRGGPQRWCARGRFRAPRR